MTNDYIIACIVKNEEEYIREFVEYHLNLGFDKVVIGNNNSSGDSYSAILCDLIEEGKVSIVDLVGKRGMQLPFYNTILQEKNFKWCAFIDCDEFITLGDSGYDNIKEFLDARDVQAYKLNWMVYGDNERIYKGEGKVTERFTFPMPLDFKYSYNFPENHHVKSIIRSDANGRFTNPHSIDRVQYYTPNGIQVDNAAFNHNPEYSIYIKHFYTKSLEEWIKYKYHRGNVCCAAVKDEDTYTMDLYFKYNKVTEEKLRYLEEHKINYGNKK